MRTKFTVKRNVKMPKTRMNTKKIAQPTRLRDFLLWWS
nr:MAG TPA: hypothetical protein [Caudoviricetes sp.]